MRKAIVGAGGKTTRIKELAKKYRDEGKKVFVTTSTHMYIENDTILSGDPEEIIEHLEKHSYAMAGMPWGEKIRELPKEVYEEVCAHADVVLVEADGSKHLPLKFPNENEPVIYENIEEIEIVCGLHGLGEKVGQAVHRAHLAEEKLGLSQERTVTPEIIETLVKKGYAEPLSEKYLNKKISVEPSHDGSLYQRAIASLLKAGEEVSLIKKEWFEPQPQLIICGGGHVSKELVKMAACLDFKIKVIDDREDFANRERFPMAEEVICDSFDNLEQYLEPNAYYIIVTREHKDDYQCVRKILKTSCRYLGMIGSRLKVQKTFDNLRKDGVSEEQLQKIFAPIGLPIGAVTPAEIAISILAEVIQEKNKMHGASVSRELLEAEGPGMLCIIIEKKGSSPRGAGSMMLITEDRIYDSIGGGAVEFAAIDDAKTCNQVMIKDYYLNDKDKESLGMICGGSNKVLFIPV